MRLLWMALMMMFTSTVFATGTVENPAPSTTEAGIGVISGWHCTSEIIEIYIDDQFIGRAGSGTPRGDTQQICGHQNTGFSLLFNYNLLSEGAHVLKAYADGDLFATRTFSSAQSGGADFRHGVSRSIIVDDFPVNGQSTILEWSTAKQNFAIKNIVSNQGLDGTYRLVRVSLQDSSDNLLDTEQANVSASGTFILSGNSYNQQMTVTINGQVTNVQFGGTLDDRGYYLIDRENNKNVVIVERGSKLITSNLIYLQGVGWVNEIDQWEKM
ncbi:hypothetical protein [Nitrincola sp. MINF-07-Sa-05]|uniref:hypothetical protein n=1 Tax=Nitrincola salilacus TaxID=3400273 RepID=UPI0039184129